MSERRGFAPETGAQGDAEIARFSEAVGVVPACIIRDGACEVHHTTDAGCCRYVWQRMRAEIARLTEAARAADATTTGQQTKPRNIWYERARAADARATAAEAQVAALMASAETASGLTLEQLRNHPAVRAYMHHVDRQTTCDLCTEPVTSEEWQWIDEGWSLACLSCIAKVKALAPEPSQTATPTLQALAPEEAPRASPLTGSVSADGGA